MSSFHFIMGQWNVACSMCGKDRKSSEMVKNWQGQWRCPEHNEERHPQDFVREIAKESVPDFIQNPADIDIVVCTPDGASAMPQLMIPGCAIPSRTFYQDDEHLYSFCTINSVMARAGIAAAGCAIVGE